VVRLISSGNTDYGYTFGGKAFPKALNLAQTKIPLPAITENISNGYPKQSVTGLYTIGQ
jgi:hypothetical protein